jgi:hypothetical protein
MAPLFVCSAVQCKAPRDLVGLWMWGACDVMQLS